MGGAAPRIHTVERAVTLHLVLVPHRRSHLHHARLSVHPRHPPKFHRMLLAAPPTAAQPAWTAYLETAVAEAGTAGPLENIAVRHVSHDLETVVATTRQAVLLQLRLRNLPSPFPRMPPAVPLTAAQPAGTAYSATVARQVDIAEPQ